MPGPRGASHPAGMTHVRHQLTDERAAAAAASAAMVNGAATVTSVTPQKAQASPANLNKPSLLPHSQPDHSIGSGSSQLNGLEAVADGGAAASLEAPLSMVAQILVSLVQFLERHKALEVVLAWILLQYLNLTFSLPMEWFFFAYYSLASFAQAAELGGAVFLLYSATIFSMDYLVLFYVPEGLTPLIATWMAYTFLVSGLHGLNWRGVLLILASTAFVLLSRDVPAPTVIKPVAAHCAGFGLCWFSYSTMRLLYTSFDNFCLYFGLIAPDPPAVSVKDVTSHSFQIYWFSPPAQEQSIKEHQIELNGVVVGKSQPAETRSGVTCHLFLFLSFFDNSFLV